MRSPLTRELREKLRSETFYRTLEIDHRSASEADRTIPASVSSEFPVQRWFGTEVLSHDDGAIDLSRAIDGALPMLYNHDTDVLIGSARDFKVSDDGKLRSVLRFAKATRAPEIYEQVREGMPLGISIGYRIDEWTERADSDEIKVTRWTLHEVSIVPVPADPTVGTNRSIEEVKMEVNDDKGKADGSPTRTLADAAPANVRLVHSRGVQEGVEAERARIAEIRSLFLQPAFQTDEYLELERLAIDSGLSIEQTRDELLSLAGSGITPLATMPRQAYAPPAPRYTGPSEQRNQMPPSPYRQPSPYQRADYQGHRPVAQLAPQAPTPYVQSGRDAMELFYEGAMRSIDLRAGMCKDVNERRAAREANEFVGMSMAEMAAECLRRAGYDLRGMDKMAIVGAALTMPAFFARSSTIAHGVGDFANLLLDAANKSLLIGWEENDETYSAWTRTMNISDFKTQNLVNLSNFGDLDVVPEYGEYRYGTFSDVKETIALRTYGKLFSISRQAIINDDLDAFTTIPSKMGRAAARMVGDEAYGVLTSNPTLNQDSLGVFHATHGNYVSSGGAAPSVTTLDAMFTAMATRTDPSGATLNLVPAFLLVPRALENTARTLVASQYDPAGTAGTLKPNAFQNRLSVVADARLDAFNAAGWFGTARPNQIGTVVVGFLNGRSEPYMEQKDAFTQDGLSMKVRLDCRAAPEDFRGMYYNDGA